MSTRELLEAAGKKSKAPKWKGKDKTIFGDPLTSFYMSGGG